MPSPSAPKLPSCLLKLARASKQYHSALPREEVSVPWSFFRLLQSAILPVLPLHVAPRRFAQSVFRVHKDDSFACGVDHPAKEGSQALRNHLVDTKHEIEPQALVHAPD